MSGVGQTWFTADLHLGHENIIRLCDRPFGTVAEMNSVLIDNWNMRVDLNDVVWVLGDYAMGSITDSLALTSELHGRKYLIAGNHDQCFHGYDPRRPEQLPEWRQRYLDAGFSGVVDGSAIRDTGSVVTLPLRAAFGGVVTVGVNHFPLTGESDPDREDRYARYRPRRVPARELPPSVSVHQPKYEWLIHGHVHNAWTVNGRQLNVGVDVWDFAPVPADTVLAVIAEGMPDCDCAGGTHQMGSPGCVLNGGPLYAPS